MKEVEFLSIRLEQCFKKTTEYGPTLQEGAFHGPSLLETINDIDHIEANKKPLLNRHSIWEITNHCSFWMNEACKAVENKPLTTVSRFEDWPISGITEREWVQAKEKLKQDYTQLHTLIIGLDEMKLDNVIQSSFHGSLFKFTLRKMLYGIIDHNLYHAGQISLLKQINR